MGASRGRAGPESVVLTDGWRGYDGLVDVGLRINKGRCFASKGVHINGVEAFWSVISGN